MIARAPMPPLAGLLTLALAALAAAACATVGPAVPWGATPEAAQELAPLPAESTVGNGVVVVLGPGAMAVASGEVGLALGAAYPDGLALEGWLEDGLPYDPNRAFGPPEDTGGAGTPALTAAEVPVLTLGATALEVGASTLQWRTEVALATTALDVEVAGVVVCAVDLEVAEAALEVPLELTRDGAGAVSVRLAGPPTLALNTEVGWEDDCPPTLAGGWWDGEGGGDADGPAPLGAGLTPWADGLVMAMADAAAERLLPVAAAVVPATLGVALAFDAEAAVVDPWGAGTLRTRVAAAAKKDAPELAALSKSGDRLVLPFEVASDGVAHPCVPSHALPPVATRKVPQLPELDGPAFLVAGDALARATAAWWAAGSMCGDRMNRAVGGQVPLDRAALAAAWPELAALPMAAELGVRLWPGDGLDVAFEAWEPSALAGEDGGAARPALRVRTGPTDVELLATVVADDTRVHLATVTLDLEVVAELVLDSTDTLRGRVVTLEVVSAGAGRGGQLSAPAAPVAEALAAPLAEALIDGWPLTSLPPLPRPADASGAAPPCRVEANGGYLVARP